MEQIGLETLMKTEEWSKGFSQYMSDIQKAIKETDSAASRISDSWSKVSSEFNKSMSGISQSSSGLSDLSGAAGDASSSFGLMSMAMFTANVAFEAVSIAGRFTIDVFKNIVKSLGDVISSGIQTVGEFQRLDIALESLAAREIKQSGAATDLSDALALAAPAARGAFNELRALSLVSPFEYEDIVNTFRLNMALGQTMDTSMDLTGAIMNMVAAGGLTGDFAERIAYNFSQMSITGKITMRDIRDLAQAGVDLSDVLHDQLGMSIEEINAQLESGQMTFEEVSQAFVTYADENFGGAAERMSRTLTGLSSSFKDLWTFASIDLFTPAMEAISEPLGRLLDYSREIVESGTLEKVGYLLGFVADEAMNAAEMAVNAGASFMESFGSSMMQTAQNAFTWGMNISIELASGMVEGAANAISQAMDYISSMLEFFLSPGSPPRVAPTIDDWGASAMNAYLQGFSEADFGILEDMQAPLKKALSTLVNVGSLDREQSGQLFNQLSIQLSEVIATGEGVEELFDSIASSTGQFGEELSQLARIQYEVAVSSKAIEEANKTIESQQENESRANEAVMKQMQEYNDLLASGASSSQLAVKLEELNIARQLSKQAKIERIAAEDKLGATKATQKSLETQEKLQQDLVSQMLQMVDATKVSFDITTGSDLSGLLDTGKLSKGIESLTKNLSNKLKGSGVGTSIGASIGEQINKSIYQKFKELELSADIEGIFKQSEMTSKLENMFQPLTDAWSEKVQPSIDKMTDSFNRLSDAITPLSNFFTDMGESLSEMLPEGFTEDIGNVTGNLLGISITGITVIGAIDAIGLALLTLQASLMNPITWMALFKDAWESDWGNIRSSTEFVVDNLTGIWNEKLLPALTGVANWTDIHVQPVFDALGHVISAVLGKGSEELAMIWNEVLQPAFSSINDFIDTHINPTFDKFVGWLSDAKVETEFFNEVLDALKKGLNGVEEFLGKVAKGIDDFAIKIEGFTLPPILTPGSPTPFELGLQGINNIIGILSGTGIPGLVFSFQSLAAASDVFININLMLLDFQQSLLNLLNSLLIVSDSFSIFLLGITALNEQYALFVSQTALLNEAFLLMIETMFSLQEIYSLFSESLSTLFKEIFVGMTDQIMSGFIPALLLLQKQLDIFSQITLKPLYDFFFLQFVPIIDVIYNYINKFLPESLQKLVVYLKSEFTDTLISTMNQMKDWAASAISAAVAVDRLEDSVWGLVNSLKALEEIGIPDQFVIHSPSDFMESMIGAAESVFALSNLALPQLKKELVDSVFSMRPQSINHFSLEPQIIVVQSEPPVVNAPNRNAVFNNYGGGDVESAFLSLLEREDMLYG